jgi:hypothetical protein
MLFLCEIIPAMMIFYMMDPASFKTVHGSIAAGMTLGNMNPMLMSHPMP